ASSIAAMYGSSCAIERALLSGVDVLDSVRGRREGAGEREIDRLLHLPLGRLGDLVRLLGAQRPVLDEPPAEARDGVAALCRLVLLGVAEHGDRLVLGVVERHAGRRDQVAVRAQAVDERLDERRSLAR